MINDEYSEQELKLALSILGRRKQSEFIEMLYYILEDDTPLFIEMFGGQQIKVPTKFEFLKTIKQVRTFLMIVNNVDKTDVFSRVSYKTKLPLEKIYARFIASYDLLIQSRKIDEIDIDLTDVNLKTLEQLYLTAKEEYNRAKDIINDKDNKDDIELDEKELDTSNNNKAEEIKQEDFNDTSFDEIDNKQLSLFSIF